MKAEIKKIELEKRFGTIHDIFTEAVLFAEVNRCQVIFPFNGCNYSVSRTSEWGEGIYHKIMNNVGSGREIIL